MDIILYLTKILSYLMVYSLTSFLGFYPDPLTFGFLYYYMFNPGIFYLFSLIAGAIFYYNQIGQHDLLYSCVRVMGSLILSNSVFYTGLYLEHAFLQSGLMFLYESGLMKVLQSAIVYREQTGQFYLIDPKVYLRVSEKYSIFSEVEVISLETCQEMCIKGQLKDLLSEKRFPRK